MSFALVALITISKSGDHTPCAVSAEVYDTYTYSDVGFDGDACPPCIVMQPPLTTLQAWMDTQDRIDLVWEEQVHNVTNCLHVKLAGVSQQVCLNLICFWNVTPL